MAVSSRSSARSSASSSDDNNKSDSNCKSDSNSNLSGERRQRGESSSGSDSAAIEFPSAAMDKKARQRQHVRRSYYRRLNRVQGMREEIQRLEERYAALLRDKEVRSAQEPAEMAVVAPLPTRREAIAELYRHLTKLKDELRDENAHMEELLEEHARFSRSLERFRDEEAEASQQQVDAGTVDEDVDLLPLTASECHALVRESYQEIVRFTQSHAYVSSGQQVFGWRDRRQLVGDQVRFIITKTFNGRDAEELTSRAWRLTTTPQGVKELYSSTMNMAVRRMQVVDADNVVIYRTISNPTRTLLVKSLFLASRFRVGAGYILLYRSIDKTRLVTPKGALSDPFRKETWLDVFTWNQLEHVGEEGANCRSSCGGIVPSTTAATPDVWMLEVLLLAVRWESKVVGPMFSLKG